MVVIAWLLFRFCFNVSNCQRWNLTIRRPLSLICIISFEATPIVTFSTKSIDCYAHPRPRGLCEISVQNSVDWQLRIIIHSPSVAQVLAPRGQRPAGTPAADEANWRLMTSIHWNSRWILQVVSEEIHFRDYVHLILDG